MKCQICNKESATIHLTEIENGVKKEVHLCEDCYKEKNTVGAPPPSIDNLIKTFINDLEDNLDENDARKCPVCGTSYADFQKKGLLGCPEDYSVFKADLEPLLEKIHGSVKHKGKVPRAVFTGRADSDRLIMLRKELDDVIKNEMYERAAELRDQIRNIEEGQEEPCS